VTDQMPEDEPAPKPRENKEESEEGTGSLALIVALVYGTGLAMNNIFLNQYGITDFSLLKPKAIFTGAIVLGSLALISAGPLSVASRLIDQGLFPRWPSKSARQQPATNRSLRFWVSLTIRLGAPLVLLALLYFFAKKCSGESLHPLRITLPMILGPTILLYLASGIATVFAIQCIRKVRNLKRAVSFSGISKRFAVLSLRLVMTLLGLGLFMIAFNHTFFPFVPSALGGPGLGNVQFEVKHDSVGELTSLGVHFTKDDPNITDPIQIIYESDDAIYVLAHYEKELPHRDPNVISFTSSMDRIVKLDKKTVTASFSPYGNGFFGGGGTD